MHTRRYSAFISYRHADNTQEGRHWAEWLHRALDRYVVPDDLIGTPNLCGEPIRAALEVSDHLIALCSPRSAVSPWVRKFKELGQPTLINIHLSPGIPGIFISV